MILFLDNSFVAKTGARDFFCSNELYDIFAFENFFCSVVYWSLNYYAENIDTTNDYKFNATVLTKPQAIHTHTHVLVLLRGRFMYLSFVFDSNISCGRQSHKGNKERHRSFNLESFMWRITSMFLFYRSVLCDSRTVVNTYRRAASTDAKNSYFIVVSLPLFLLYGTIDLYSFRPLLSSHKTGGKKNKNHQSLKHTSRQYSNIVDWSITTGVK